MEGLRGLCKIQEASRRRFPKVGWQRYLLIDPEGKMRKANMEEMETIRGHFKPQEFKDLDFKELLRKYRKKKGETS